MELQSLGYVGIGGTALDDWSDFATRWLGMQQVEAGRHDACFPHG